MTEDSVANATLVLAGVTALAVIVPVIQRWVAARRAHKVVRNEVATILEALGSKVDLITQKPGHVFTGFSVDTMAARIFSRDVAESLSGTDLSNVYVAMGVALDFLIGYSQAMQHGAVTEHMAAEYANNGPVVYGRLAQASELLNRRK